MFEDWLAFFAMLSAGAITLLSSFAFMALILFVLSTPFLLFSFVFADGSGDRSSLELSFLWFCVWGFFGGLLALRNVMLGLRTMNDRSLSNCAHLFGSSAAIMVVCPLVWIDVW
jgi:hypothetical protein